MIRPPRHFVGIEPIFDNDFYNPTSQLIKIPEASKERCDQGIVKYVGQDVDPDIKIGDHVIFSGYTGNTIGVDKELIIMMHYKFIRAKLDVDDYNVPGLYLKGKLNTAQLCDRLYEDGFEQEMVDIAIKAFSKHLDEVMIPAPYATATRFIADAHDSLITVNPDSHINQRDEIDEDNL